MLIVGLAAGACGASSSPTAPVAAAASLGAGNYSLIMFGTSTCLSGAGTGAGVSSASITVLLSPTAAPDVWSVSVPGQSLAGEVALVNGQVQGWLRGSATGDTVRLSTGATPDAAVAMESTKASHGTYEGPVLVGTPRYEGTGSASGAYTTCSTNAFTLQRA
ncbi:MAG TPA: hypothetical protein VFZ36_00670 [Vicinamibacterales bacterium]